MRIKHPPGISLCVIAYGIWVSRDLIAVWQTSPLDHYGWLPLLIWLIPAYGWKRTIEHTQTGILTAALSFILIGTLSSLNSLNQLGLAIAITSLRAFSWRSLVWAGSAISWLPTLGWALTHLFPRIDVSTMLMVRVLIASIGVLIMLRRSR